MSKKLLCIICSLVISLSIFVVPTFADSLNNLEFQPLPYVDTLPSNPKLSDFTSNGFQIINNYSGNYINYILVNRDNFYLVAYNESSSINIALVSPVSFNPQSSYLVGRVTSSGYFTSSTPSSKSSSYNNTSDLYYSYSAIPSVNSSDLLNVPFYSSFSDAFQAVRNYIDNPPSSDPIYDDIPDFYIQRGYAAYIDFGSDYASRTAKATFNSDFSRYSSLFSGDWDSVDNRRYAWASELPNNTNFSGSFGSPIDWTKVDPFDVLGRSKRGVWFLNTTPQSRYLVIVNPNLWSYGQNAAEDQINSPILVHDLSGSTGEVKFYALNQRFDSQGTLVSSQNDNSNNNINGSYDPDTGNFNQTDFSGNSASQNPGGDSDTPVIQSVGDYVNQIGQTLSNFANSLLDLLQKPISHITQLIDAGSGFMQGLRGMYSWMPVEIQNYLISALTLIIAIGVFKVFL